MRDTYVVKNQAVSLSLRVHYKPEAICQAQSDVWITTMLEKLADLAVLLLGTTSRMQILQAYLFDEYYNKALKVTGIQVTAIIQAIQREIENGKNEEEEIRNP